MKRSLAMFFLALLAPVLAQAAEPALDLLDAPVAYSASFYVSSDKGTYHGQVWHAPGRERRDYETKGGGQTVLLRRDADAAYLMKPSGRWYVGLGFRAVGALAGGVDSLMVERTKLREESVAGIRATRYKVAASGPKGSRFDGDAWFSREGILVKAAGTITESNGRKSPVETGLSDLRLGAVSDNLFEVPQGWFGMDLRNVPPDQVEKAVQSIRPLLEGRGG